MNQFSHMDCAAQAAFVTMYASFRSYNVPALLAYQTVCFFLFGALPRKVYSK